MFSLSINDLVVEHRTSRGVVHAVNGVSLQVGQSEIVGLVGESGCGKSTLARCTVALTRPTAGAVLLGSEQRDCFALSRRERSKTIQMVFQDPLGSLNPRRTVRQTIDEPMALHGSAGNKKERDEKIAELVARVGLGRHQLEKYPHELSGGQRQRVGLARALASSPELIICDESVSALDVSVQAQVLNLLSELQDQFKISYLFISHDLKVVRFMARRIAVMYFGKIVEIGPTEEVWNRHRHPYTRALISASVDLQVDESEIKPVDPPSPFNPPPGCAFHTRCPRASGVCRSNEPALSEAGSQHLMACHHPL
jgi:peptide/nickel transport system ATP-binding protein